MDLALQASCAEICISLNIGTHLKRKFNLIYTQLFCTEQETSTNNKAQQNNTVNASISSFCTTKPKPDNAAAKIHNNLCNYFLSSATIIAVLGSKLSFFFARTSPTGWEWPISCSTSVRDRTDFKTELLPQRAQPGSDLADRIFRFHKHLCQFIFCWVSPNWSNDLCM